MTEKCRLIQGWFALFIQGLLGLMCILTLVVKRHNEVPQRNWNVWALDALKQGLGSTFGHFANIVLAVVINLDTFVISSNVDECEWYCLSYLVDSTFGITLNLMMLTFVENITKRNSECSRYVKFGEYGNPPMMSLFLPQLSIWLLIVIMTKCITYSTQLYFAESLGIFMNYLLFSVQSNPKLELVIVMIIIPVTVNSLQFWVTDMFLKGADDDDDHGHRHDDILINSNSDSSDISINDSHDNYDNNRSKDDDNINGSSTTTTNDTNDTNNANSLSGLLSPQRLDRAIKRLTQLHVRGAETAVQMTDYGLLDDALLLSKHNEEDEKEDEHNCHSHDGHHVNNNSNTINNSDNSNNCNNNSDNNWSNNDNDDSGNNNNNNNNNTNSCGSSTNNSTSNDGSYSIRIAPVISPLHS